MEQLKDKTSNPCRLSNKKQFDKRLIKKVVLAIENGLPRSEAMLQYGVSKSSLVIWMNKYGSRGYHQSQRVTVSTSQKRSVVTAIENGRMTIVEAQAAYNIKSAKTIKAWLATCVQENTDLVISNACVMDNKKDQPQSMVDKETEALKKALEHAQLKIRALNTLIDIAEEQFKIPIRKKPGARQS